MKEIKYLSLFSGIGGFELGIKQANEDNNSDKTKESVRLDKTGLRQEGDIGLPISEYGDGGRLCPTCIGYSEIDKYAIQVYEKHFKHKNYGDITDIEPKSLPDFDLLVGGFPCQAFSIAGKRRGFNDTRGTLFFEVARIVREKQPRLLLLENVKGLLSHDKGNTFFTIISTLDELGYDCQWQVLNSKNFGVPQNRERVFIIGHLRGTSRPEVFPLEGSNPKTLNQIIGGGQGNRVYGIDGVSCTQASQAGGQGAKTGLYAIPVITPDRPKKRQNGRRFKTDGEPAFTVTAQDRHGILINKTVRTGGRGSLTKKHNWDTHLIDGQIRRLTPKECERLQGFPDDWTKKGIEGKISNSQRYKMCGNAVTVNVVKEIIIKLLWKK